MSPWTYMLIGAGGLMLLSTIGAAVVSSEIREALLQLLGALVLGPAMLIVAWARRGPRLIPLSQAALRRFASQSTGEFGRGLTEVDRAAYLLGYGGRGVILVRRRRNDGWINNLVNGAARARKDAGRSRRTKPIEVRK